MQWLFAQFTNYQIAQVRYITNPLAETFVSFTYSHLSLLVNYANEEGESKAEELLYQIFSTIAALNPSKNAVDYWLAVNKSIMGFSKIIVDLLKVEKLAATESIEIAKEEGIMYLASEREKIMRMNHEEALK